jgi:hypothetical protein
MSANDRSEQNYAVLTDRAGLETPADEATTMRASLEQNQYLDEESFVKYSPEALTTAKDKLLAAVLDLLARHASGNMQREQFASNALYLNAKTIAKTSKVHAMHMMLAISRLEGLNPRLLVMACEPPLRLDVVEGRYLMSCQGNGMGSHHVSTYIVRMLARVLTLYWNDCSMAPRDAAAEILPPATAALYF